MIKAAIIRVPPGSRRRSRLKILWTRSCPIPGMLNMVSTITDPPKINPTLMRSIVTTGMRLFLRTCLVTTTRSLRPLDHAVRT